MCEGKASDEENDAVVSVRPPATLAALHQRDEESAKQQQPRTRKRQHPMSLEIHRLTHSPDSKNIPQPMKRRLTSMILTMDPDSIGRSANADSNGANTRMRMPISRAVSPSNCFARCHLSTESTLATAMPAKCRQDLERNECPGAEITLGCALWGCSFCPPTHRIAIVDNTATPGGAGVTNPARLRSYPRNPVEIPQSADGTSFALAAATMGACPRTTIWTPAVPA